MIFYFFLHFSVYFRVQVFIPDVVVLQWCLWMVDTKSLCENLQILVIIYLHLALCVNNLVMIFQPTQGTVFTLAPLELSGFKSFFIKL